MEQVRTPSETHWQDRQVGTESQISQTQRTAGWEPSPHKAPNQVGAKNKASSFPGARKTPSGLSFLIFSILWIYLGSVPIYCKLWF